MHVIVVGNTKGGSGKTNLAVHLAGLAHERGLGAGLIDLDPTASASRWVSAAGLEIACTQPTRRDTERMLRLMHSLDLVIIDTPAVMAEALATSLEFADLVLVPVHSGNGDIDQVVDTDALLRLARRGRPELRTRVVINHTGRIPTLDRETREAIREYGLEVASTDIPFLKAYAGAKGTIPSAERAPHYNALLNEVLEVLR